MTPVGKKIILLALALFTVNILLYLPSLGHDFLKDDFRLIVENPRIKEFKSFLNSISGQFFSFPDFPYLHYWRPFSLFTFFIDYKLWGLNPSGFHLSNILVNAFNAILIFLIFYFISEKILYSFFISLLFSLHPAHVEAVSWVSGRTDLLAAFFIFSAFLFFVIFLKRKKVLFYLLSTVCFVLGLLSKENAVLFPLAAAGLIFLFNHMQKKEKKVFFFILPLVVIDILYMALHNKFTGVQSVLQDFSFNDFPLIFKTIGVYTKIILTPFSPAPYFSMQQFEQAQISFYIYFLIALALLVWVILKRKEYRYTLYSLLFFIFLLPVLDPAIIPTNPRIAFRFAYIPIVIAGVFLMDTLQLLKNKKVKTLFVALLMVMSGTWAVESFHFQGYFKNRVEHYRQLVKHYPDDSALLLPLALQEAETGDYGKALERINHALEINQKDRWGDISEPAGLLKANLMVISGNRADAGEGKTIAEKIGTETKEKGVKYFAFLVLAKFYEKKQTFPFALELLEKARNIGETSDLFYRMTLVCAKMKNYQKALSYLEKAKSMNPTLPRYNELKNVLLNAQRREITRD